MSFCVYLLEDCNGYGYIGSTCNLKRRLGGHKRDNNCESKLLTKPFNHLVLEEIEDEDNLKFAEQFYIKLYKSLYGDKLLNKVIPLRTNKEYNNDNKDKIREKRKEYNNDNKDKIREKRKEYCLVNKDKIREKRKEYCLVNKDKIREKIKEYRLVNKDKIKEYCSQKIECECGSTIQLQEKSRHLKSKKHINFTKQ